VFTGPPENTREHVLAATKALLAGEWHKACDYILGLEVWKLIPNEGGEKVKQMLRVRIKEEAVRTYLLLNGEHYESLSLSHICSMFDMDQTITRRIICRMIFNKEISAAWEHPANILVIYKTEVTSLQALSQNVADKVSLLLESNERLLDPLVGVYGYKDDWNTRDGRKPWVDKSGGDANVRKNRNVGWKTSSQRPLPGSRGGGSNGGRGGRGSGRGGVKQAWGSGGGRGNASNNNGSSGVGPTGTNSKASSGKFSTEGSQPPPTPKRWATTTA